MNAHTISELAVAVADVVATSGDPAMHVEMSECGDGSTRYFALVTTYDAVNDLEQVFRITTAAPDGAPAWAADFEASVELRIGEDWMALAVEDAS